MYQILVLEWESSFIPLLQRVWISVAAHSSQSQTVLWCFFFLQTIIAFLLFLFCKCCRPTAYCWIVFSLESQPIWLVSLAFSHHAPPPSGLCFGGTECKREGRRSRCGTAWSTDTELQSGFGSCPFYFLPPKRSTLILGPEKSRDSSCTVFSEDDLCSSAPPLTHAAH